MARIPNLKIVAGPSKNDVKVFNLDTGEAITNVYSIDFNLVAGASPVVQVNITAGVKIEYEGSGDVDPEVFHQIGAPVDDDTKWERIGSEIDNAVKKD